MFLEKDVCYGQCVLLVKLKRAFDLLYFVLQWQICLLLQVSLDFLLLHSNPLWWKGHILWVLVLEGLVGIHRTIQLQPLLYYWLGDRLGLLWYEWLDLEMNRVHLVIFELAPKNCISDSSVNLENIVVQETKGLANWSPKLYTYPLDHKQFWTWGDQIPLVVALALGEQSKI